MVLKQQKVTLTVLEARSPKSVVLSQDVRVSKEMLYVEPLGENPFFASFSFWSLSVLLHLWPNHTNLCLSGHIAFFSLVCLISLCFSPIRIMVMALKAHPSNTKWSPHLKISKLTSPQRAFFPNEVKDIRMWIYSAETTEYKGTLIVPS